MTNAARTRPRFRRLLAVLVIVVATLVSSGCGEPEEGLNDTGSTSAAKDQGDGTQGNIVFVSGPIVAPATKASTYRIEVYPREPDGSLAPKMKCYYGNYKASDASRCTS